MCLHYLSLLFKDVAHLEIKHDFWAGQAYVFRCPRLKNHALSLFFFGSNEPNPGTATLSISPQLLFKTVAKASSNLLTSLLLRPQLI
jgi:hypothetical protein